jgi:hypothetical protein
MIYCGSGFFFYFGKGSIPAPAPVPSPVPGPDNIWQFFAFSMSDAALFPQKSWPLSFDFLTFFILFYVGSGTGIPVLIPLKHKVAVPAVASRFRIHNTADDQRHYTSSAIRNVFEMTL